MADPIPELLAYYAKGKPLECELDPQPYRCEFWPKDELDKLNVAYQVPVYAPGFFGFASSGGGEMFAISPKHEIVCLPFIGMAPSEALLVAESWATFERLLKCAP